MRSGLTSGLLCSRFPWTPSPTPPRNPPPPEEDEEVGEGEAGGQPDHADHHGGEVGGGGEGRAGGAGAGAHQRHVVPEVSLRLPVKDLSEYLDNVSADNRGSAELPHKTSNVFQINLL